MSDFDENLAGHIVGQIENRLLSLQGFGEWWYSIEDRDRWGIRMDLVERVRQVLNEETETFTATTGNPVQGWPV